MRNDDILIGHLLEDSWLTLEQAADACLVDPAWLRGRLQAGLFPRTDCVAGLWRLDSTALSRARRMRGLERDFDAVPELAALMADLMEEVDALRARLRRAGLD